ncbi:MAG TPA: hypothetical protein VIH42_06075, partial [Thermoguttaceae bacterium]
QPSADVTVTITPQSPNDQLMVNSTSQPINLTFTTSNWNTPQKVTVTASDDYVTEGTHTGTITHSLSSGDPDYNNQPVVNLTINITENPPAQVSITPLTSLTPNEDNGTAQFSVVLATQPSSDVTINLTSTDPTRSQINVPGPIVADYAGQFQSDNSPNQGDYGWWYYGYYQPGTDGAYDPNAFQELTFYYFPGGVDPGSGIAYPAYHTWNNWDKGGGVSLEAYAYGGIPGSNQWIDVRIVVQEDGTYRLSGSLAKLDWTVWYTDAQGRRGGDGVTGALYLTSNQTTDQIWTSYVAGDEIYDPGGGYDWLLGPDRNKTGVPILMDINLNAGDILDFTVDPNTFDSWGEYCRLALSLQKMQESVTFTPANWEIPQTATITALGDSVANGDITYSIISTASSSDPNYNGISVPVVNVTNIDNDAPQLSMPLTQSVISSVIFSNATGNAIRVQNVDTSVNPLHVQLTATNGQLTLGSTAGLTFIVGRGAGDSTLEFLGSATAVNAALEGMQFNPTDTTGNLQVVVNSQGVTDPDGSQTAVGLVGVQVIAPQYMPIFGLNPSPTNGSATPSAYSSVTSSLQPLESLANNEKSISQDSSRHLGAQTGSEQRPGCHAIINNMDTTEGKAVAIETDKSSDFGEDLLSMRDRYYTSASLQVAPKSGYQTVVYQSASLNPQLLWKEFDTMAQQAEDMAWLNNITTETAIGIGAGLSAGYVIWLIRGSALLTSTLASLPMWQLVNPLPILESWEFKSKKQKRHDEIEEDKKSKKEDSLASLVS